MIKFFIPIIIAFILGGTLSADDNILVRRNYRGYSQPRSVVTKRSVAIQPLKKNYSLVLDSDGSPAIIPTEDLKNGKPNYCLINCGP